VFPRHQLTGPSEEEEELQQRHVFSLLSLNDPNHLTYLTTEHFMFPSLLTIFRKSKLFEMSVSYVKMADFVDLVVHSHISTINSREANVPQLIQIYIQLQFAW
jgi:hypothetical protein